MSPTLVVSTSLAASFCAIMAQSGADVLMIADTSLFNAHRYQLVTLAAAQMSPALIAPKSSCSPRGKWANSTIPP
jgi:hypothetical protein